MKTRRYTVHSVEEQRVMETAIAFAGLFGDVNVVRTYIGDDLDDMRYEIETTCVQFDYIDDAFRLAL